MVKWGKILKIAVPATMVTAMVVAPVAIYFCIDDKVLNVTTKDIVIDPTTGGASFKFTLNEPTQDGEVLVSIINKSHDSLINLFSSQADPYSSSKSLIYPVVNNEVTIYLSFSKFIGDNIDAIFDLEVNYFNKHGKIRTKIARNMKLSTKYIHPEGNLEQVHIYDLNDFHGAAEGYGDDDPDHVFNNISYKNPGALRIADQIHKQIEQYPGSILVTAGDNNSGDTFSTSTHGATLYPVLKAMGARYSAVGNHAFEWGLDDTASERFDQWARTPETYGKYLICSNIINHPWYQGKTWTFNPDWNDPVQVEQFNSDYITWQNQRVSWADPFKMINMNGHLVCLLGLTTESAMEDGNQAVVRSFSFADYAASLYYASKYCYESIGQEWYDSIETFVILTHVESVSAEDRQKGLTSIAYDMAKDIVLYDPTHAAESHDNDPTRKVSAVISAHSHKVVEDVAVNTRTNQPISIGQAETAGRRYLDTTLWFDNSKPIGKRWVVPTSINESISKPHKVTIDYGGLDPAHYEDWTDADKAHALEAATNEIKQLHNNPSDDYLKQVVDTYYEQVGVCKDKLNNVIAYSKTGEKYLPHDFGPLGHEYWPNPESALPYGQYIQPMGAWANMAQILGFDSIFSDEILSPDSSVTYPSISFFNVDTLTTTFKPESDIKLSNIYDLLGYENSLYFGFLSIWQLANIIDYLLSGFNQFEYGATANHSYVKMPEDAGNDHSLQYNYHAFPDDQTKKIECAENTVEDCLYLCGPYQWYGFSFTYDEIKDVNEQTRLDRKVKLHYKPYQIVVDGEEVTKYYPDIKIYCPRNAPQEDILSPDDWIDAKTYEEEIGLIPCVVHSFIYEGGNGQSTMFKQYMDYNASKGNGYNVHHFSAISRDMLIEFCRLTREMPSIAHFDLDEATTAKLMTEYKQ